jgi:hypothetical protein
MPKAAQAPRTLSRAPGRPSRPSSECPSQLPSLERAASGALDHDALGLPCLVLSERRLAGHASQWVRRGRRHSNAYPSADAMSMPSHGETMQQNPPAGHTVDSGVAAENRRTLPRKTAQSSSIPTVRERQRSPRAGEKLGYFGAARSGFTHPVRGSGNRHVSRMDPSRWKWRTNPRGPCTGPC